jgi:hypothetical protein
VLTKKIQVASAVSPSLGDAAKRIELALDTISAFVVRTQDPVAIETSMRQVTYALGRATAATLLLEQAAWAISAKAEGADQDVLAVNQWCHDSEFIKPLVAPTSDVILQGKF